MKSRQALPFTLLTLSCFCGCIMCLAGCGEKQAVPAVPAAPVKELHGREPTFEPTRDDRAALAKEVSDAVRKVLVPGARTEDLRTLWEAYSHKSFTEPTGGEAVLQAELKRGLVAEELRSKNSRFFEDRQLWRAVAARNVIAHELCSQKSGILQMEGLLEDAYAREVPTSGDILTIRMFTGASGLVSEQIDPSPDIVSRWQRLAGSVNPCVQLGTIVATSRIRLDDGDKSSLLQVLLNSPSPVVVEVALDTLRLSSEPATRAFLMKAASSGNLPPGSVQIIERRMGILH